MLLLPLQGFAAATAFDCHAQVQHQHQNQHQHHHEASDDAAPTVVDAHMAHADSKPAKCNSCSPCCAGVLVGQVRTPAFAAARDSANFAEPATQVPSPTLAGLDRPPRHHLL